MISNKNLYHDALKSIYYFFLFKYSAANQKQTVESQKIMQAKVDAQLESYRLFKQNTPDDFENFFKTLEEYEKKAAASFKKKFEYSHSN